MHNVDPTRLPEEKLYALYRKYTLQRNNNCISESVEELIQLLWRGIFFIYALPCCRQSCMTDDNIAKLNLKLQEWIDREIDKLTFKSFKGAITAFAGRHCKYPVLLDSGAALVSRYKLVAEQEQQKIIIELDYRNSDKVYASLCVRFKENQALIKPAISIFFEKLPEYLIRYQVQNFANWMYRCVQNIVLDLLKKEPPQMTSPDEAEHEIGEETSNPREIHPTEERYEKLMCCLEKLKGKNPAQYKAVYLKYFENRKGNSYQAVQEKMKLSFNDVKSLLQNGRRFLKICMEK